MAKKKQRHIVPPQRGILISKYFEFGYKSDNCSKLKTTNAIVTFDLHSTAMIM